MAQTKKFNHVPCIVSEYDSVARITVIRAMHDLQVVPFAPFHTLHQHKEYFQLGALNHGEPSNTKFVPHTYASSTKSTQLLQ